MVNFEWDELKNVKNLEKHQISFEKAQDAFFDKNRIITIDHKHSTKDEVRYFCFGMVDERVMTVRFTIRNSKIRIFGAGFWSQGKLIYGKK